VYETQTDTFSFKETTLHFLLHFLSLLVRITLIMTIQICYRHYT